MKKEITYLQNYQKFEEVITNDDGTIERKSDVFKKKELKEKIIINEKAVIVFLDDGTKGVAKCHPDDDFAQTKGVKIAYIRAKIKSLIKELKELTGKSIKLKIK